MIQITVSHRGLTELLRNLNNVPCQRLFVDAANRAVVEVHKWSLVEVPKRTHQLMKSHIIRPAFLNVMSAEAVSYTHLLAQRTSQSAVHLLVN